MQVILLLPCGPLWNGRICSACWFQRLKKQCQFSRGLSSVSSQAASDATRLCMIASGFLKAGPPLMSVYRVLQLCVARRFQEMEKGTPCLQTSLQCGRGCSSWLLLWSPASVHQAPGLQQHLACCTARPHHLLEADIFHQCNCRR